MSGTPTVVVHRDVAALAADAAARIASALRAALEARGEAHLVLTGGATPVPVYERLAAGARAPGDLAHGVDWRRVDLWWGDERAVPPDDPESNYGMAARTLLLPLGLQGPRVHRMRGELPAEEAAELYAQELRRAADAQRAAVGSPAPRRAGDAAPGAGGRVGEAPGAGRQAPVAPGQARWVAGVGGSTTPHFDVVLLGVGQDGHVASLFPGTPVSALAGRAVVATTSPLPPTARISLTPPVLVKTRLLLFLVAGRAKAPVVAAALDADPRRRASVVAGSLPAVDGEVVWLLDGLAASGLGAR